MSERAKGASHQAGEVLLVHCTAHSIELTFHALCDTVDATAGKYPTKWVNLACKRGTLPRVLDIGTNFPGQNRSPSDFSQQNLVNWRENEKSRMRKVMNAFPFLILSEP